MKTQKVQFWQGVCWVPGPLTLWGYSAQRGPMSATTFELEHSTPGRHVGTPGWSCLMNVPFLGDRVPHEWHLSPSALFCATSLCLVSDWTRPVPNLRSHHSVCTECCLQPVFLLNAILRDPQKSSRLGLSCSWLEWSSAQVNPQNTAFPLLYDNSAILPWIT